MVAGHVAREAHPDDRRRVQLRATRRAVRLGEEFFGPVIAAMAVEMGTYSKRETAAITRFLRAMTDIASAAQRE